MHYANKWFVATCCNMSREFFPWMLQEVLVKNVETQNKLPRNLRVPATNEINRNQFWMRCFYCRCPFGALSTSAAKWNQSSGPQIILSLFLSRIPRRVSAAFVAPWQYFGHSAGGEQGQDRRRVVINHARLSDKVAVQQQVLCPLRGCESKERERERE